MNAMKLIMPRLNLSALAVLAAGFLAGCASTGTNSTPTVSTAAPPPPCWPGLIPSNSNSTPTVSTAAPPVSAPAVPPVPVVIAPTVRAVELPLRIKAAATEPFTDKNGQLWLADQGFADGETTERPEVTIIGASDPRIYQSERFSMTSFTQPLPNGNYLVKLHFCETYEGITGPGQRVFSFTVAGHEFKDFDVWVKSGGFLHAYVETVPVEITTGKLEITFTPNIENPEINGIEILAAP